MAKGGNGNSGSTSASTSTSTGNTGTNSGASTAAGIGTSVGSNTSSTATNAAGNPGSAAAAQAAAAQANAANAANSGGVSVNTGSNNAAVNSGPVTASYDNAGSLTGKGYSSSTSGWGGGYGAAAAMNGLTTATQRGEDGHAQGSTAGGFGSGYATSSPNAAPTSMGSVFSSMGPVGRALSNIANAVTGGDSHVATYYGRVDGSGYYGPASLGNESTSNAISNLGTATPASSPAAASNPSSPAAAAEPSGPTLGHNDYTPGSPATPASNTNNNAYSSGSNSGAVYRGGTVTDNGSGGSVSSGITPPSRDTSSIGLGVYNPDKANYDQDNWNRGMEVQSSSLVSDEECKAFAKRAFSENTEPFKKVRVTIIKKV